MFNTGCTRRDISLNIESSWIHGQSVTMIQRRAEFNSSINILIAAVLKYEQDSRYYIIILEIQLYHVYMA